MNVLTRCVFFLMPLALTGCLIGNGRICGPFGPMANCDRKVYRELLYPTPLRDYWQSESRSEKQRQRDWLACGGTEWGSYSDEDEEAAAKFSESKFKRMQRCMMVKGYQYIGTCEGKIPSQYPVCLERNAAKPTD